MDIESLRHYLIVGRRLCFAVGYCVGLLGLMRTYLNYLNYLTVKWVAGSLGGDMNFFIGSKLISVKEIAFRPLMNNCNWGRKY